MYLANKHPQLQDQQLEPSKLHNDCRLYNTFVEYRPQGIQDPLRLQAQAPASATLEPFLYLV